VKHFPATEHLLECYEVVDEFTLTIWNEKGDVTAQVVRPDGTRGIAYGGPVYTPLEFLNVCERATNDPILGGDGIHCPFVCEHERDLNDAEKLVALELLHRVGWDV
jgi:hypothetical protein